MNLVIFYRKNRFFIITPGTLHPMCYIFNVHFPSKREPNVSFANRVLNRATRRPILLYPHKLSSVYTCITMQLCAYFNAKWTPVFNIRDVHLRFQKYIMLFNILNWNYHQDNKIDNLHAYCVLIKTSYKHWFAIFRIL